MRRSTRRIVVGTQLLLSALLLWHVSPGNADGQAVPRHAEVSANQTGRPMNQTGTNTSTTWLARYDQLPDLYALARASGAKDVHAEQERLAREHDAQKKPYRLSMPYRNPGQPCKSGEHHVAMIRYTLVNPARNERAELWEAELHEAKVHGAALPEAVVKFLERLGEK